MTAEYNETNLGDISINNEVIKNIALKAATEIKGVYGVKSNIFKKLLSSLMRKEPATGVSLEFVGGSEIKLALKIVVGYGLNIPHIAGIVQENVKKAIEHMTGLTVSEVSVKIVEVEPQSSLPSRDELVEEDEAPAGLNDKTAT